MQGIRVHGPRVRSRRGWLVAALALTLLSGCSAEEAAPGAVQWLARTRDDISTVVPTITQVGDERTLVAPLRGEPDPYVVALATAGLAEQFGSVDMDSQATIRGHLVGAVADEGFPSSSVDSLYTASALLRAGEIADAYDQDDVAALRRAVVDAAARAPDYSDHIDALVALGAVPDEDGEYERLEGAVAEWAQRSKEVVCSSDVNRLDYWIAANVPQMDIECLSPDTTTWLRDATALAERLELAEPLDAALCEEARWILEAPSALRWDVPEVHALQDELRRGLAERTTLGDLVDPVQCAAAAAAVDVPRDPGLVAYLTSVAVRGGEAATVRLDPYAVTRLALLARMLDVRTNVDVELLETADEFLALDVTVPGDDGGDAPGPPGEDATTVEAVHLLESVLRRPEARCSEPWADEWIAFGLDVGSRGTDEAGVLAAMAIRAGRECDRSSAVDEELHDTLLESAERWRDAGASGESLAALWTAESITCALAPELVAPADERWAWVEPYVDPEGSVYGGRAFSPVETYFAVALLEMDKDSCRDTGIADGLS